MNKEKEARALDPIQNKNIDIKYHREKTSLNYQEIISSGENIFKEHNKTNDNKVRILIVDYSTEKIRKF